MSGALVLDSEGLAKAVEKDREVHEWLTAAREADLPVVTSAAVLVEVIHPKLKDAALRWTLSRLLVEQPPRLSLSLLLCCGESACTGTSTPLTPCCARLPWSSRAG